MNTLTSLELEIYEEMKSGTLYEASITGYDAYFLQGLFISNGLDCLTDGEFLWVI